MGTMAAAWTCAAAAMTTADAAFDNGIICSHEQFVLAPDEQYEATIDAFRASGMVWFTADKAEVERLRAVVFRTGHLNKDVVGRSAQEIGVKAGLDIPVSISVILVVADGAGIADVLAKEKLCPVVAILPYTDFHDAISKAKANLLVEGAGHSAALHSHDADHIRTMDLALPISRLVVNQASSLKAGGSVSLFRSCSKQHADLDYRTSKPCVLERHEGKLDPMPASRHQAASRRQCRLL